MEQGYFSDAKSYSASLECQEYSRILRKLNVLEDIGKCLQIVPILIHIIFPNCCVLCFKTELQIQVKWAFYERSREDGTD